MPQRGTENACLWLLTATLAYWPVICKYQTMMDYALSLILPIFPLLSALVSFGLGLFIFIRNPRHPANIGFALGMLSLVLIEAGDAIFLISDSNTGSMFGMRLSKAGEAFLPATWFLFSLTFARANYKEILSRWIPILAALYAGSFFFIFWMKSPSFISLPNTTEAYNILILGPIGRYFHIFLLIGMLINLIHLENTLRSSAGSKRQQIKYLIIGIGAVFSFYIYLSSKALLFSFLDTSYIPVTSLIILISCGLALLSVVRHRLLDVDIFISRYVIYNSLTVLFVGAYLLIIGLVAQGIKLAGGSFDTFWSIIFTFTAILGMVVVLFSGSLRRKAQLFINRHFYKHKYEFRDKWMETTEKIGAKIDLSQIQKVIVELISQTMGVREVYLWLYEPVHREYHLAVSTVNPAGQIRLKEGHLLISYIKKYSAPFLINKVEKDMHEFIEEVAPLIIATKAILCTPLIAGDGELIGFILQGEDISGEPYRKDDFDLLKAIASHAASRIKNILLTQEVIAAKEAETFHQVSSFFIHDLKNLVSTLSLLVQNAEDYLDNPSFQKDAMRILKTTVSKMNTMISNLTILSKGLRINLQPVNLNGLLEETLSTLNGQVSSRILRRLETLPPVLADGEQLRKVCLNLLLNAVEASSQEGDIEVRTSAKNGEVILTVTDHGCGMSHEFIQSSLFRPFRTTKSKGIGIGLFQCKKIVEAHKGRIEVESEEGKGSEFRVIFPVNMAESLR